MNTTITRLLSSTVLIGALSLSLIAQDAKKETPAPATTAKKTCTMGACCAAMMQPPKKGFHATIEWGGVYGGGSNNISYSMFGHTSNMDMRFRESLRIGAGYLFNPYLYVGAGAGAEFQYKAYINTQLPDNRGVAMPYVNPNYTGSLWVVPVYGEIRGYLLKGTISPFVQLRVGYAPTIYIADGITTVMHSSYNNLSVGVRVFKHINITAGYLLRYQPAAVVGYETLYGVHNRLLTNSSSPLEHRFTLSMGIQF